jgi:ankyrin repeat protein
MASSNGHIDVLKLLLEHGADVIAVGISPHQLSGPLHSQLDSR